MTLGSSGTKDADKLELEIMFALGGGLFFYVVGTVLACYPRDCQTFPSLGVLHVLIVVADIWGRSSNVAPYNLQVFITLLGGER